MKFNSEVPFPSFWFETNRAWGPCNSVEALESRIKAYNTEPYNPEPAEDILKRCKNAAYITLDDEGNEEKYQHDLSNFGTRSEHVYGNTTLYDFLVEKGVIEP